MSRRSFFVALGGLLAAALGGAAILIGLVRHEPAQYVRPPIAEGAADIQLRSNEFLGKLSGLVTSIHSEREWGEQFSDEQINSYLEEEFIRSGQRLPDGISKPRVIFATDHIRLAFRYGSGAWSTVISVNLRVWLPKCEPNVVALELEGFHAGALPISAQSLLERVAEVARQNGIDVSWYRTNGHPVALLRFGTDQPRMTVVVDAVKLQAGSLAVKGHAIEPIAGSVMLPRPDAAATPTE